MPTVDEYLQMLTPDPAQRKQQQIAALLGGLGAGLLSAPGWNRGIANAGLLAAQNVNAVPYQMRQDAIDNIKMREAVQGLADKDQQRASDQAWQSQLPALFQGPSPAQRLGSGSPTVGNAAALGAMPQETAFQKYSRLADAAFAAGRPKDAELYASYADKNRPKVKNENTGTDAQGNRVRYVTYEDGTTQVLPLGPDKEKLNFVSTGGQVGVGLDPFTGKQQSAGLTATMDPAQIDASKRGWANFGLDQQKFDWQQLQDKTTGSVKVGDTVAGIRKEYNNLQPVQNYVAAAPLVQSALKAPDTPAGDLDVIYAVGKALDPNSVVREGELNLVIKSGSPLQRFQGLVNSIGSGRGRLPPEQRQQLLGMLSNRVSQLKAAHDMAAAPYIKQAESLGLPMDQIFQVDMPSASGGLTPAEQQELAALKKRFGRQ